MIYVAYFDPSGRITDVEYGAASAIGNNPWAIEITSTQFATIKATHHVDVSTKVLVPGVIQDPNPPTLADVRAQRDTLLSGAGQRLTEWQLSDSFPLLTATQKQAKIDALITYRQSLRDITTQSDPANIAWPVAPV